MPPRPKLTSLSAEIVTRILRFVGQEDYSTCSILGRNFCEPAQGLLWRSQTSLLPILKVIPAFDWNAETELWGLPPFEDRPPISADELKLFDKVRARVRFLSITFSSNYWDICPKTIALLQKHYGDRPKGLFPNLISLNAKYSYKASLRPFSILHFLHSPVLRNAVFKEEQDMDRPLSTPNVLCHHVAAYLHVIGWRLRDGCRFKLQSLYVPQAPDPTAIGSIRRFRGLTVLDMARNFTVPIRYDFIEALATLSKLQSLTIMAPKFLGPPPSSNDSTPQSSPSDTSTIAVARAAAPCPKPYFEHLSSLEISTYFGELVDLFGFIKLGNIEDVITHFWVHEDTFRLHTYEWSELFDALHSAIEHDNPIYLELTPTELLSDARVRFANMFDEEKFPTVPFEEFSESILRLNLTDFSLPDPLVRHFDGEDVERMLSRWTTFDRCALEDEERRRYRRVNADIGKYNRDHADENAPVLRIVAVE